MSPSQNLDPTNGQPALGEQPAEARLSRRGFMRLGLGVLSAIAVLEAGGAGFTFLRARSLEGKVGGVVTAGPVDSFPPGSVTEFEGEHFYLIRSTDGGFLAMHNRCTHLGCTVNWVPEQNGFVCPCHAASFDFYGNMEGPPVPRPLDILAVRFEDQLVRIDTSRLQQRKTFEPEQLAYCPSGILSQASS